MQQYLDLLKEVLNAPVRGDRTGTGTQSVFGRQLRFNNIDSHFPIITTKKVGLRLVFHELKWMLMGETNIKYLVDNNVGLWTDWPFKHWWMTTNNKSANDFNEFKKDKALALEYRRAFEENIRSDAEFAATWGDCGPVYGYQWRHWLGKRHFTSDQDPIDQIQEVLDTLKRNPEDRRMIVSAWNVGDIPEMVPTGLPPCHLLFQFYTREMALSERLDWMKRREIQAHGGEDYLDKYGVPRRFLDCMVIIRSNDLFLGAPFNISQYALLTTLMAETAGMCPGELVYTIGDAHIYSNHRDQCIEQVTRTPHTLPRLVVKKRYDDPAHYNWEDLELVGYTHEETIKGDVAV